MKKILNKYGTLFLFIVFLVICLIINSVKTKQLESKIQNNCVNYTKCYMDKRINDFTEIDSNYNYTINEDSFKKTNKGYYLEVCLNKGNKKCETYKLDFNNKITDDTWIFDNKDTDSKLIEQLENLKKQNNPVNIVVQKLYDKYALPLIECGCKIDCHLEDNYNKDGTISYTIMYSKKNLKTNHYFNYVVKVNKDGSFYILDETEA